MDFGCKVLQCSTIVLVLVIGIILFLVLLVLLYFVVCTGSTCLDQITGDDLAFPFKHGSVLGASTTCLDQVAFPLKQWPCTCTSYLLPPF